MKKFLLMFLLIPNLVFAVPSFDSLSGEIKPEVFNESWQIEINEPQVIDWDKAEIITAMAKSSLLNDPLFSGILDTVDLISSPIVYNYLIIPVCFPDTDAYVNYPIEYLDTLLFDMNYNSVAKYYHDVSFGKIQIVAPILPSQLGWVTAPFSYTYYTNGNYGLGQEPNNLTYLAKTVIRKCDSLGINYSWYDNDKNGYVDGIGFITCLPGAEVTDNIYHPWSVKWGFAPIRLDNVWVGQSFYLAAGRHDASHNSRPRLGVHAHEIGHMFGFSDHYASTWGGTGNFDLMANGSWNNGGNTPSGLTAFDYIRLGWVEPIVISPGDKPITDTIHPILRSPKIYKVFMAEGNTREYFLITVRGDTLWDDYIPGYGLTIERVSEIGSQSKGWCATISQYQSGKPVVMLEQADGLCSMASGSRGDNTDPFPLINNYNFTTTSYPPSVYYTLTPTGVNITNIKRLDNTKMSPVTFTIDICDCGISGDVTGDSVVNAIDVNNIVEVAWRGGAPTKNVNCNYFKQDVNLDGIIDIFDVVSIIGKAFRGRELPKPCN